MRSSFKPKGFALDCRFSLLCRRKGLPSFITHCSSLATSVSLLTVFLSSNSWTRRLVSISSAFKCALSFADSPICSLRSLLSPPSPGATIQCTRPHVRAQQVREFRGTISLRGMKCFIPMYGFSGVLKNFNQRHHTAVRDWLTPFYSFRLCLTCPLCCLPPTLAVSFELVSSLCAIQPQRRRVYKAL